MACVNPNSPEFVAALERTGNELLAELLVQNKLQASDPAYVQYQFKAVENIVKNIDKVKNLWKQLGGNATFWNKIQQDLQIPKPQIELLKSSKGESIEEKLASFIADYSYAIEINITKEISTSRVTYDENGPFGEVSEPYETGKTSSYYSNLTVPGGTSYTENEIATPAITSSIKGHAQFATDKGIGWFRSDDKILVEDTGEIDEPYYTDEEGWVYHNTKKKHISTKTRRILEVQSDLFQKGRDKEELSNPIEKVEYKGKQYEIAAYLENGDIQLQNINSEELYDGPIVKFSEVKDLSRQKNEFLQLLNKDNNWVTFFIKSIIQDSAKKGYEKVLFPSGNTASKVEGHSTLEEFKKQKEDRIKQLEEQIKINDNLEAVEVEDSTGKYYRLQTKDTKEQMRGSYRTLESANVAINKELPKKEIAALKQELERVEKEGFGALKPIFNFYENTIANVLKKQGYNPKQITDEYGNTWEEVKIQAGRDLNNINFNLKSGPVNKTANANTLKKVNEFLKRIGVDVQKVKQIVVDGVVQDAEGVADFLQQLIQVVEGKEDVALTEEAMHFAVEILEQTNPKLFQELLKNINKYAVYQQVLDTYSSNPYYKTKDGKPDILKLKKEAIAKKLADILVEKTQNDGVIKDNAFVNLWLKIKQFFQNLFSKAGFNPFEQAVEKVLSGEMTAVQSEGIMFQLQSAEQEGVTEVQRKIVADLKTKKQDKKGDKYFLPGSTTPLGRVTDFTKAFYERIFKSKDIDKTEKQKAIDDIYSDYGDAVHEDIRHVVESVTDENGLLLPDIDSKDSSYVPKTDAKVYRALRKNIIKRMSLFPAGTVFMAEVLVNNGKDLGGTIDFLAITKNGKVSIFDWKSMGLDIDKYEDVPWYKKKAFRIQLAKYKKILQDNYGLRPSDFEKVEAIPIIVKYKYSRDAEGDYIPSATGVLIGNADVGLVEEDYFLPVSLESQTTGDKHLDSLIKKFTGLRETIEEKKVTTPLDRKKKAEQLNALERALRHLQVKKSVEPLISQAEAYTQEIEDLFEYYEKTLKDVDFATVDKKVLNEYALKLSRAFDYINLYTNLDNELGYMFKGELSETQEKLLDRINEVVKNARHLNAHLNEINNEFGSKIAESRGIKDLLRPEMVVDMIDRLWKSTAKIPMRTLQTFYKFRQEAQNLMDYKTDQENRELIAIEKEYLKWAESKGISKDSLFDILKVKGKNILIDEFNKEFYSSAKKALLAKDFSWVAENVDIEAYKEGLIEKLRKDQEYYSTKFYTGKDAEKQRERDIKKLVEQYSIDNDDSLGWFSHYEVLRKFPRKDKWTSEEWKKLTAPENAPAKNLYDWILKINTKADEAGYLPDSRETSARIFLPFVRKSLLEKVLTGGKLKIGESFLDSITMDENTYGYGVIDKVTNKLINKIPVYFTSDPEVELSEDLFRNLGLYNDYVNRFQQLSEIEGLALSLGRVEQNKRSIQTSYWGKPSFNIETEDFDYIEKNDKNADLYERQVATLVYGQRDIQSERFDQALGKVNSATKTLNKFFGVKIFPEDLQDKQLSLIKSMDTMNNFFQQTKLGLNILPALSNLAGGSINAMILAGKYFNKKDVVKSEYEITTKSFSGDRGKLVTAAIKYFMPFTDEMNRELLAELSLKKVSDESVQDFLFWMMRKGDRIVQGTLFLANLRNQVIIDGKIYNAREYVRNSPEYRDRYGSPEKLAKAEDEFEAKVEELIKQHGLLDQAQVVNEELTIPGVERNSEEVFKIRNLSRELSKKVLGNMSADEVRGTQQNAFLRSAMIFKNWIPNQADARFGAMKYNSATDAYEWGRMRTMARYFAENGLRSFLTLKDVIEGTPKGLEQLQEMYEQKKKSYYLATGQELDLSPEEFYDLVRLNLRSAVKEAIATASVISMFWAVVAAAPPDEDKQAKNIHKFSVRAMDKVKDELLFFWWPAQTQQILSGSLFPSMGVVNDAINLIKHVMFEVWGVAFDEELADKNHAIKYMLKPFPIVSQMAAYSPLFLPELAKDLDIRISTESRARQ